MHHLPVHHQRTFDQLDVQQDSYIHAFTAMIRKLDGVSRDQLFSRFEDGWSQDPALSRTSWRLARGIFGETVLHWIALQRSANRTGSFSQLLFDLACEIMDREPRLISCIYEEHPYKGESMLHQAVGTADHMLLSEILRRKESQPEADINLDIRATGDFFTEPTKYRVGVSTHHGIVIDFVTPLCIATVAPKEDDDSLHILTQLLEAGARSVFTNADGSIHSSVLHHIAMARWTYPDQNLKKNEDGVRNEGIITPERLVALLEFFLDGKFKLHPNQPSSFYAVSPLQLAAQVGNKEFVNFLIGKEARVMWQWGHKLEMRFRLDELDSSGKDWEKTSVLELLVAHKHKRMLCNGLFVAIMNRKWEMFGRMLSLMQCIIMTTVVMLVTLGCLKFLTPELRLMCKLSALVLSSVIIIYVTYMTMAARHCSWFRHLQWTGNEARLSVWELGAFRDTFVLFMAVVTIVLHLYEEWDEMHAGADGSHRNLFIFIDEFTAVLIFFGWVDLLRFFGMFKATGNIILSLPQIMRGDMVPWMIVYGMVMVASAGAIRVSLAHRVKEGDENYQIVGTYLRTLLTLEEATHGPDVSWRAIVMNSPMMAGFFFLIFLWVVTVVLFNILIAMFTDTFERVSQHSFRERLYARAVTVITQEKLMPNWYAKWIGLPMGLPMHHPRGEISVSALDEESSDGDTDRPSLQASRWLPIEQDLNNEMWNKPLTASVHWI